MGCFSSKNWELLIKTAKFKAWNEHFKILSLSLSDLKNLHKIFSRVDFDNSGDISLAELLAHINLDRTRFTERIFSIFDDDKSGQVDFHEFVLSVWNYCTLTKATLDMFAFDLYDQDSSGELSVKEIREMASDIYGKAGLKTNFHARNFIKELSDIEMRSGGASLRFEEFRLFTKNHPAMLFPAFRMQLALQQKILGVRFWNFNANRRLKLAKGIYISIDKFLEMNTNAKDDLIETNLFKNKISIVAIGKADLSLIKANETAKNIMQLTGTRAERNWTTATDKLKHKRALGSVPEQTVLSSGDNNNSASSHAATDMPEYLMNGRELEMKTTSGSSGSSTKKQRPAVKSLWQRGLSAISLISHESTSTQLTKSTGSNHHHHHKQESVEDVGGENDDKHLLYHHHSRQSLVKNKVNSPRGRSGTLTLEAVHAIQEVSPLQAWEKQLGIDDARHRRKEGSRVTNFHDTSNESSPNSPRRANTPPALSPRRSLHSSSFNRRNTALVVPIMSAGGGGIGDTPKGRSKARRNTVLAMG